MAALVSEADYAARYGEPDASLSKRLDALLGDAEALALAAYERRWGAEHKAGAHPAFDRSVAAVCCAVVARALNAPGFAPGATQLTESLGDYSRSYSLGGGSGELWLGKSDLLRLGLAPGAAVGFWVPGDGEREDEDDAS